MFSHADIWRAIDRLASDRGYSPSGLAKKAGLDPTTFNKSKRVSADGKPRWPSTESISKILSVTDATMAEFLNLMDNETAGGGALRAGEPVALQKKDGSTLTGTLSKQAGETIVLKSTDGEQKISRGDVVWFAHILFRE
jgi:phage repressor protein C with HTH and peptisase S24 domain